jgi:hypothetical protein
MEPLDQDLLRHLKPDRHLKAQRHDIEEEEEEDASPADLLLPSPSSWCHFSGDQLWRLGGSASSAIIQRELVR